MAAPKDVRVLDPTGHWQTIKGPQGKPGDPATVTNGDGTKVTYSGSKAEVAARISPKPNSLLEIDDKGNLFGPGGALKTPPVDRPYTIGIDDVWMTLRKDSAVRGDSEWTIGPANYPKGATIQLVHARPDISSTIHLVAGGGYELSLLTPRKKRVKTVGDMIVRPGGVAVLQRDQKGWIIWPVNTHVTVDASGKITGAFPAVVPGPNAKDVNPDGTDALEEEEAQQEEPQPEPAKTNPDTEANE